MKIIILLGLVFAAALSALAQSSGDSPPTFDLPPVMPAETEMRYGEGGGMTRYFMHVTVSGNRLSIERLTPKDRSPKRWSAQISDEDKNALYRAFAAAEFDFLEIDANKATVYDAPSQLIFISAGGKSYEISSGAGSPLAGTNLKSYESISQAFEKLRAAYKNKMKRAK